MNLIKNIPFYFDFHKYHIIPEDIELLTLAYNETVLYNKRDTPVHNKNFAYQIRLFPSYMGMKIVNQDKYTKKIIPDKYIDGCAISLGNYENIKEYINVHYKNKGNFRNKINKNLKRLEICFDIKYDMFHGHISKKDYNSLMDILKDMLTSRFSQINKTNFALLKWDDMYNSCYEMINNKKASLFVIYSNNKPINISLNYHYNDIMFGSVSSFDLNYSKFGLGHIQIYKLLDWCFINKYKMLDMCHGNLDYKKMWCNVIYNFENHIFYKKKSIIAFLINLIIVFKIHVKLFFKRFELDLFFEKITIAWKNKNKIKEVKPELLKYNREVLESIEIILEKNMVKEITSVQHTHSYLLKPLYDFLYLNEENINNVKIYEHEKIANTFYFTGQKKFIKIDVI